TEAEAERMAAAVVKPPWRCHPTLRPLVFYASHPPAPIASTWLQIGKVKAGLDYHWAGERPTYARYPRVQPCRCQCHLLVP
ncbi:pleckstrin-like protein, partial [Lasius niger]